MSLKKLELELSAIYSAYEQKVPYKENSYYYPFFNLEKPLEVIATVAQLGYIVPAKQDEEDYTIITGNLSDINVVNKIFYRDYKEEENDCINITGMLSAIEIVDTIFYRKYEKEEDNYTSITGVLNEITISDLLYYITHTQTEEDYINMIGKLTAINVEELE